MNINLACLQSYVIEVKPLLENFGDKFSLLVVSPQEAEDADPEMWDLLIILYDLYVILRKCAE